MKWTIALLPLVAAHKGHHHHYHHRNMQETRVQHYEEASPAVQVRASARSKTRIWVKPQPILHHFVYFCIHINYMTYFNIITLKLPKLRAIRC